MEYQCCASLFADPGGDRRVASLPTRHARGFPWGYLAWAILAGCTPYQLAHRTLVSELAAYPRVTEGKLSCMVYYNWAREAWVQCAADVGAAHSYEFKNGFMRGFVDYVYAGGNGEPPAVPPPRFWKNAYRSAQGDADIADWNAGFRLGARIAREHGYRRRAVVPAADSLAPPFAGAGAVPPELEDAMNQDAEGGMFWEPGDEVVAPPFPSNETPEELPATGEPTPAGPKASEPTPAEAPSVPADPAPQENEDAGAAKEPEELPPATNSESTQEPAEASPDQASPASEPTTESTPEATASEPPDQEIPTEDLVPPASPTESEPPSDLPSTPGTEPETSAVPSLPEPGTTPAPEVLPTDDTPLQNPFGDEPSQEGDNLTPLPDAPATEEIDFLLPSEARAAPRVPSALEFFRNEGLDEGVAELMSGEGVMAAQALVADPGNDAPDEPSLRPSSISAPPLLLPAHAIQSFVPAKPAAIRPSTPEQGGAPRDLPKSKRPAPDKNKLQTHEGQGGSAAPPTGFQSITKPITPGWQPRAAR